MSIQERMIKGWLERLSPGEMSDLVDKFLPPMLKKLGPDGLQGLMARLDPDFLLPMLDNLPVETKARLVAETLPSFLEKTLAQLPKDEALQTLASWSDAIESLEEELGVRDESGSPIDR